MNRVSRFSLAAFLIGLSIVPAAHAGMQADFAVVLRGGAVSSITVADGQEDAQYVQGHKAMDEQRWSDAVTAFDGVKGKQADAALYWKAYSLDKLKRTDEARDVCVSLKKQEPKSSWNRECFLLQTRGVTDTHTLEALAKANVALNGTFQTLSKMDMHPFEVYAYGNDPQFYTLKSGPATEEDIKILALSSLMQQDPAKALPMLRTLVKSDKSIAMRRQALFVLSRSKDPEAQKLLTEVATTKGDPELQTQAVRMLAMSRGKDVGPTLVEVYRGASDASVKRAAVNGLFMSHDAPRLVELARGEKDLNLKRDIVSQLSLMKDPAATDYMLELLK